MEKHTIFDEVYGILERHSGVNGSEQREGAQDIADSYAHRVTPHPTTESGKMHRETSFLSAVPLKLSELASEEYKTEWVWQGMLARGYLTLFYALWKSGKTTLISHLIKALNSGSPFIGLPTEQVSALVVSEENKALWVERRDDLGFDCWILPRPIRNRLQPKEWEAFVRNIVDFCREKNIGAVIIDTISAFWSVKNENDAAEIQAALLPLNELLEDNIAVLMVHHFRKSAGDEGTGSRGSGAIPSAADILMELRRLPNDHQSAERVITTYSRFNETPPESVIELTPKGYIMKGSKRNVLFERKLEDVLLRLRGHPEGLSVQELHELWSKEGKAPTERTIRNHLNALEAQGKVRPRGEKVVGKSKTATWTACADESAGMASPEG